MPMPAREPTPNEANALWRSGSRAFFKDQRAAQVGDIVTILVSMNDTADMKNATTTSRNSTETGSLASFFGMQTRLPTSITDPSKILNVGSRQQQRRFGADPAQRGGDDTAGGRGDAGAAERQPGGVGAAGVPGEQRTARAAGDRRDPAAGHRVATTRCCMTGWPRRGSLMAGAGS